eukprot:1186363-Prorocentrum_minimum.AAC.3
MSESTPFGTEGGKGGGGTLRPVAPSLAAAPLRPPPIARASVRSPAMASAAASGTTISCPVRITCHPNDADVRLLRLREVHLVA